MEDDVPLLDTVVDVSMGAGAASGAAGDSDSDDSGDCRICGGGGGTYISPCRCIGSVSKVHPECLQRWISTRPANNRSRMTCELCHTPYNVVFDRQFVFDCEHSCSCIAIGHLFEAAMLVGTLVCVVVTMVLMRPFFKDQAPAELGLLATLTVCSVLLSIVTIFKVLKRWQNASSVVRLVAGPVTSASTEEAPLPPV